MKKILLIQPHSDDIVLSCFSVIVANPYSKITILTIEKDEKRMKEDLLLCDLFDNLTIEFGLELKDLSYYEYYKLHPNIFLPEESLKFVDNNVIKEVRKIINTVLVSEHWDEIYSPLGIGHPFHYMVYDILKNKATHFYQDWPHSYKRRSKVFCAEQKMKYKSVSVFDDSDFLQMKEQTAKMIYKSQSSLFFFEQGNIKKHFSDKIYKA